MVKVPPNWELSASGAASPCSAVHHPLEGLTGEAGASYGKTLVSPKSFGGVPLYFMGVSLLLIMVKQDVLKFSGCQRGK